MDAPSSSPTAVPLARATDAESLQRLSRKVWLVVGALGVAAMAAAGLAWAAGEAAVATKPKVVATVPVRVTEAARQTLALRTTRRGELDADAAELSARTGGYLVDLSVGIGDRVEEGDILAQVEPAQAESALGEARAEVAAAAAAKKRVEAQLAAARVEKERGDQGLARQVVSEREALELGARVAILAAESDAARANFARAVARANTLREQRRDTAVVAPFAGAVAQRYVDQGTIVAPGTRVLRLMRSGPLRVLFRLPERDIGLVREGMALSITTQASGPERFEGKVVRIAAELSRVDRTIAVEGVLAGEHPALKPGMYAEVRLSLGDLPDAVVVPSGSIVQRLLPDHSQEQGVFVVDDGSAVWKPVQVRGAAGEVTAVDGVSAGAKVVILGQANLVDGAPVRVTEPPGA